VLVAFFWPVGIFLVPMYAYHWPAFPDFAYSWVVQVLGVVLGVSGGLLYSRSVRALGARMTPVIQVRRGDELVEEGPYRVVRHPMYIAVVMISLGQTLLCLSLPAAILTLILLGLAIYRAQLEEGLLGSTEGFGTAYASYATRTGMFLPTFRSPRKGRMDPRHPPRVKPTGGIP
jgi:protein-S-isoprenylcysteine O-methyltransferase Ste14